MIRYTFKYVEGKHTAGCFNCGNAPVGIQTDRLTGEEYWICKSCIRKGGFARRTSLHLDFKKQSKSSKDLHMKNQEKTIQTKLSDQEVRQ